jgi:hypothetical protein
MCTAVRDLLPEFVLGVLPPGQRAEVEGHVAWCAGCRKEAAELGHGAATLAFALPPASPPSYVEHAVVDSIRSAATAPTARRRTRTAAAATVAAMVAISALGWGAVMAGRAERFEARAAEELRARQQAIQQFERFAAGRTGLFELLPPNETHLGQLTPVGEGTSGGGFVLQLASPDWIDFTFTHVSGLPTDPARAPYRVYLRNADGDEIAAGRIASVDRVDGTGEVFREFVTSDLEGFTTVVVRDSDGATVMRGTIQANP